VVAVNAIAESVAHVDWLCVPSDPTGVRVAVWVLSVLVRVRG
jgi:hypothetical protein